MYIQISQGGKSGAAGTPQYVAMTLLMECQRFQFRNNLNYRPRQCRH